MEKPLTNRKKTIVNLTIAFLFYLFLSVVPIFSQCNFAKSAAHMPVTQLVRCLENEKRDPERDIFTRRELIFEIHKRGKEAIPNLIDNISNRKVIPTMLDNPRSSARQGKYISTGLVSTFIIEVILSKETLMENRYRFIISILGSAEENYPYWDGDIRDSGNKFIKPEDLPKIQKVYQAWWEKNKDTPIDVLRERWKKGERILDGKEYKWT